MVVVAMLMASLWLVGVSSPRGVSGLIHLLLISAIVMLLFKTFERPGRRSPNRDVRWPPPWTPG
jgi:hypothetical protein